MKSGDGSGLEIQRAIVTCGGEGAHHDLQALLGKHPFCILIVLKKMQFLNHGTW